MPECCTHMHEAVSMETKLLNLLNLKSFLLKKKMWWMNKNMHLLIECVEIIGASFDGMMTKSMPPPYFFPLFCF